MRDTNRTTVVVEFEDEAHVVTIEGRWELEDAHEDARQA
jgi:hypothetical protein